MPADRTGETARRPRLNPHIFRAYDIRGVVGEDLGSEVAALIGSAYGTYLRRAYGGETMVLGRDNRPSSPSLRDGFVRGARAAGVSVVDIGLAPSPLLYFAAAAWGIDGGASVTGSHNPPHMNGLKLLERRGIPIAPEEIQAVRALAEARDFESGAGGLEERDPKPAYWDFLGRRFSLARRLKVVTDAGNGVAACTGPEALRRIGCDVAETYSELDGTYPHHLPDPQEPAAMEALRAAVIAHGGDCGIAWDGDGDRLGVVDERGRRHEPDEILALLARDFLGRHPGARVLIDVKCSATVVRAIEDAGGLPVFAPSGHSLGKRKMREEGIRFGGESSGHFYFGEDYPGLDYGIDDAVFGACAVAELLARGPTPLSARFEEMRAGLPRLITSPELKLPCPDADKFGVAAAVAKRFRGRYPVLAIDGARIEFPGGWALVRASNTTPVLSVRLEAESAERYDAIRAMIWEALAEHPAVTIPEGAGRLGDAAEA